MIDPSDHHQQFIDLIQTCSNNKTVRTSLKFNNTTVCRHLHAYMNPPIRIMAHVQTLQNLEKTIFQSLEKMYQQHNTFSSSSSSPSSTTTSVAWPSPAFRQSCQKAIPLVQNDFPPCFFVYPVHYNFIDPKPTSSTTPTATPTELDFPESIDEVNDPIAWPSQVVAMVTDSVRVQVEAITPRDSRFNQSKQYQVQQNVGTTAAWCASPVGMDHPKIDATTGKPMGGVVLNTCVKSRTLLHSYCNDFVHRHQLEDICPSNQWASARNKDIQHSLVTGWHHGMTRSYTVGHDAGASSVQVQVHNVVGGTSFYLGLPREVALRLKALHGATKTFIEHHTEANWVQEQTPLGMFVQQVQHQNRVYELNLLKQLLSQGMLEYNAVEAEEVRILESRRMCGTCGYCASTVVLGVRWYCCFFVPRTLVARC